MKNYTIYLHADFDVEKGASKKIIEEAREKAKEKAVKTFKKDIEDLTKAKTVKIAKEQTETGAVQLSIDEGKLEDVIAQFVKIEIVQTIDAGYNGPKIEDKEETTISTKEKMEKYLK